MSSDNKMKGLLKGLRFISQIFDSNEKQEEIEIGNPTDVKHVAHIGSDGPIENAPSWMNEFKSTPGLSSSAPLNMHGNTHCQESDDSVKWVSSDSMKRGSRSKNVEDDTNELPLPKSSKQQSNSGGIMRESHAKEKSDKPRQPKRNSKSSTPNDTLNESKLTTIEQPIQMDSDSLQLQRPTNDNLPPRTQPDQLKRTHSKKTKDTQNVGGSSKPRSKAQVKEMEPDSNEGTHSRIGSKTKEPNSNEGTHSRTGSKTKEPNSNEGSHSRTGSRSKDSNSTEGTHSRTGSRSKDSNSNEVSHSRTSSKSKDSNSNEGSHSRSDSKETSHTRRSSKSKETNCTEGHRSRSDPKSTNKQRFGEENGQVETGFSEEIMRINYPN